MIEGNRHACHRLAKRARKFMLGMHARTNASHIGSGFSCVDILCCLYGKVLRVFPDSPRHPDRDRFILSKGHGASALYATLAACGLMEEDTLKGYYADGGDLPGHPVRGKPLWVEASTGSLGHGLPIACGIAHALKLANNNGPRVFVLMGDGEIQEGSVWEGINAASRLGLDNLTAIVDANAWQAYERTDSIMPVTSFAAKFSAFGWAVQEIDGHDYHKICTELAARPVDGPNVILAHTIKGKGIKEFEDNLEWHYKSPAPEQLESYYSQLDAS